MVVTRARLLVRVTRPPELVRLTPIAPDESVRVMPAPEVLLDMTPPESRHVTRPGPPEPLHVKRPAEDVRLMLEDCTPPAEDKPGRLWRGGGKSEGSEALLPCNLPLADAATATEGDAALEGVRLITPDSEGVLLIPPDSVRVMEAEGVRLTAPKAAVRLRQELLDDGLVRGDATASVPCSCASTSSLSSLACVMYTEAEHIFTCMYVYAHVCIHTHVYMHKNVCVCIYTDLYTNVC